MKVPFHVKTSLRADIEIGSDVIKQTIATEVVRFAESLHLGEGRYALVNVPGEEVGINDCDFKVLVRLAPRELHIMTAEEAEDSGLTKLNAEPMDGD